MLKSITFALVFFLGYSFTMAHYSIHSSGPGVNVESGGKTLEAKKGMQLKANDYIVIPQGSMVEIYNDLDKSIYKSVDSGKISVTRLMINAKKAAGDNRKNVASRLQLAKNSNAEGEKIYVEKGMVRRSLAVFDPEADNLQVDSKSLAKQIAGFLSQSEQGNGTTIPVEVSQGTLDSVGVFFKVVNTMDSPVYFNVLKIYDSPDSENRKVEISSMGQPDGSYVLLPGQALTRESYNQFPSGEQHLLVVTHIRYDLDEVVDETGALLNSPKDNSDDSIDFPTLIRKL